MVLLVCPVRCGPPPPGEHAAGAGGERPAFDGTRWNRENSGGFRDAQLLSKAQAEDFALLHAQMLQRFGQVMVSFPTLEPFRRIWFAGRHGGHLSTQFDTAGIGAGVIVTGQMVSDSVEPRAERARIWN
nr:hypothetical protein [Dictyobacter arantiisoli]